METLEYLAYAGILFGMIVSAFIIDWKDKKTYRNIFIISLVFLVTIFLTALTDYDYLSMGLSFIAMAFCYWYIRTRAPQE